MTPRLQEKYKNEIVPNMMQRFGLKNPMQIPRFQKIVINMGVGAAAEDIKVLESAMDNLAVITGQKPVMRRAKKAISNFKLKKNSPVGCMVTLRGRRMYEFLDRLINVAIPRIKDFRGVSDKAFDAGNNYTFGLTEQLIFPEIDYDKVAKVQGMNVTIVMNAQTRQLAMELLKQAGMPFKTG